MSILKKYRKLIFTILLLLLIGGIIRVTGVYKYISMENAKKLQAWVESLGILGPIVFIVAYIVACVFFIGGIPLTVVGALAFGPIKGALLSTTGATLGAGVAFLIARYAGRDMVEKWVRQNKGLNKIDEGVEKHGWRMVMITRLVPLFPFNLQNFVYGITKVKFSTFMAISWFCMLPAAIAFSFMAGSFVKGEGNLGKTFAYLAVGAVFFVLITLLPGFIKKRKNLYIEEDLEKDLE